MPGGRPSKYTEDMQFQADAYVGGGYKEDGAVYPDAGRLARNLGVARSTLYEWGKDHPQFSDILQNLQEEQHYQLTNRGLMGEFNANICKLMLGKHGYVDKSETKAEVVLAQKSAEELEAELEGIDDELDALG